ncbi:MAG TPA: hypothetical protein VFG81_20525 [Anaerolineales bacterium]|jgi:hypothetical protein|nr:hypothetical protein [Anaerolineales bacterium]
MTTPDTDQNQASKMKKLTSDTDVDKSTQDRLPPRNDADRSRAAVSSPPSLPPATTESKPRRWRWQFLPAFWTIASILSFAVNIVLIIVLLMAFQLLDQIQSLQSYGMGQASGLLGGLYSNFVKMDQASIRTNIHVEKDIPVQFSLNVSGPTNVTLSQPVTIDGALVTVQTGGLNITGARATIVLPQGVVLPIQIENLVVPVDQQVPAVLDVPVDIPLSQTELHEPFVGLQEVVKPWYCLIQPNATVNGFQVCASDPTLVAPELRPTPVETVTP